MIKLKPLLTEDKVVKISLQAAQDKKMFGPVYHGTNEQNRSKIDVEGFKIIMGLTGTSGISNGYDNRPYGTSMAPPPIHHLGFGVYFTTAKAIAKKFAGGTARGMKIYFLDAPRLETINWGSTNTMMKWWIQNGYDPKLAMQGEGGRYAATVKLTEHLKSKYDVVWYKGKGMYRLLDGDQAVCFDPANIYEIDLSLSKGLDVGAKVIAKRDIEYLNYKGEQYRLVQAGDKGIIMARQDITIDRQECPNHWAKRADKYVLDVKFKNAGRQRVEDTDIEPLSQ